MHPAISHHLAEAHIADLRHRAERETLASAARRARAGQRGPAAPHRAALGRRVLDALGARDT